MADGYKQFEVSTRLEDLVFTYNKEETEALKILSEQKADINDDLINRIKLWKIGRRVSVGRDVIKDMEKLRDDSDLCIDSLLSKEVMLALVKQHGIGYPVASAILKFLRPDVFPIIDVRAYRALYGFTLDQTSYSWCMYLHYVHELKRIYSHEQHENLDFRDIDEKLYCYDKQEFAKLSAEEKDAIKITPEGKAELKSMDC